MSAVRLARAATGRDRIIKFEGCYHGHADPFLVKAGSGATTLGAPTSPGVPRKAVQHTLLATYNDLASVERLCDTNRHQIAAVIVEPLAGNMGVVLPADGFLAGPARPVRPQRHAADLRRGDLGLPRGGRAARSRSGKVKPDLTCLGKIIGGGLPVGAYGGRADLMEYVSPAGPVYQAGTLSGNPLAMAAGLWSLNGLSKPLYKRLARLGGMLAVGLAEAAREAGVPLQVNAHGSLLTPFFTERAGARLPLGAAGEQPAVRRLLPRHAGARHLPAAVAVRGLVPLGRPHRGGRAGRSARRTPR